MLPKSLSFFGLVAGDYVFWQPWRSGQYIMHCIALFCCAFMRLL